MKGKKTLGKIKKKKNTLKKAKGLFHFLKKKDTPVTTVTLGDVKLKEEDDKKKMDTMMVTNDRRQNEKNRKFIIRSILKLINEFIRRLRNFKRSRKTFVNNSLIKLEEHSEELNTNFDLKIQFENDFSNPDNYIDILNKIKNKWDKNISGEFKTVLEVVLINHNKGETLNFPKTHPIYKLLELIEKMLLKSNIPPESLISNKEGFSFKPENLFCFYFLLGKTDKDLGSLVSSERSTSNRSSNSERISPKTAMLRASQGKGKNKRTRRIKLKKKLTRHKRK